MCIGELASAVRNRTDIKFGLYHSMFEWFNPLWKEDSSSKFATNYFVHVSMYYILYICEYVLYTLYM